MQLRSSSPTSKCSIEGVRNFESSEEGKGKQCEGNCKYGKYNTTLVRFQHCSNGVDINSVTGDIEQFDNRPFLAVRSIGYLTSAFSTTFSYFSGGGRTLFWVLI